MHPRRWPARVAQIPTGTEPHQSGSGPSLCGEHNLNQAARILNAGGDPPEWLKSMIALTDGVLHSIDRAVQYLLARPRGRS